MTLLDILLTTLIIVMFCLGFRTLLSDGQILHFLREPFEYEKDSKLNNYYRNKLREYVLASKEDAYAMRRRYATLSDRMSFVLKPFLLCAICFSSVWGSTVFILLHGLRWELFLCIISSTFIIKIINDQVDW